MPGLTHANINEAKKLVALLMKLAVAAGKRAPFREAVAAAKISRHTTDNNKKFAVKVNEKGIQRLHDQASSLVACFKEHSGETENTDTFKVPRIFLLFFLLLVVVLPVLFLLPGKKIIPVGSASLSATAQGSLGCPTSSAPCSTEDGGLLAAPLRFLGARSHGASAFCAQPHTAGFFI